MMLFVLLCLITLFVAYANGANDNFKGVATLYGANVASYKQAITIAPIATFVGCMASVFFAEALITAFSGKGLVPDALAASPIFLIAVATGAGATVILATLLGLPISTTHSLTGAVVGGFDGGRRRTEDGYLGVRLFLPLLLSPLISILLTMPLYKAAQGLAKRFGITKQSCVCVAPGQFVPVAAFSEVNVPLVDETIQRGPVVAIGTASACMEKYDGSVLGITAQKLIDSIHYVSAAAVSFARGFNDGPKIIGLLLVMKALDLQVSMLTVAGAMAIGGWLSAHKVAVTMSKKISRMSDGQAHCQPGHCLHGYFSRAVSVCPCRRRTFLSARLQALASSTALSTKPSSVAFCWLGC